MIYTIDTFSATSLVDASLCENVVALLAFVQECLAGSAFVNTMLLVKLPF